MGEWGELRNELFFEVWHRLLPSAKVQTINLLLIESVFPRQRGGSNQGSN